MHWIWTCLPSSRGWDRAEARARQRHCSLSGWPDAHWEASALQTLLSFPNTLALSGHKQHWVFIVHASREFIVSLIIMVQLCLCVCVWSQCSFPLCFSSDLILSVYTSEMEYRFISVKPLRRDEQSSVSHETVGVFLGLSGNTLNMSCVFVFYSKYFKQVNNNTKEIMPSFFFYNKNHNNNQ